MTNRQPLAEGERRFGFADSVVGRDRVVDRAVVVHDARTGNTASEVGVVKEVCGAVYDGPYLVADALGSSGPS